MRVLERIVSRAAGLSGFIAMIFLFVMMVQVSLDVLGKWLFNNPIPMTLELVSSYYMVALVFLPLGVVTRDQEHLEVELFTQRLSPRRLAWFRAFGCAVGVAFIGFMIYCGTGEAIYKTQIREYREAAAQFIEIWPTRWFYPVGCLLMAIYLALQLIDNLSFAIAGRRLIPHPAGDTEGQADLRAD